MFHWVTLSERFLRVEGLHHGAIKNLQSILAESRASAFCEPKDTTGQSRTSTAPLQSPERVPMFSIGTSRGRVEGHQGNYITNTHQYTKEVISRQDRIGTRSSAVMNSSGLEVHRHDFHASKTRCNYKCGTVKSYMIGGLIRSELELAQHSQTDRCVPRVVFEELRGLSNIDSCFTV